MGALTPMRPMRSGYIHHFFFAFRAICNPERQNETKSRFSSCRCAAACLSHEPATWATRGGFGRLSRPCHEPLQVPMWLWLPRSARRADGDETRSRAKSGEAGDWADRNAAFCCSFCSRRSHLTHVTGHFSPVASGRSFISPLVFLAQGAPKQSARNQGAPRFSDTVVCLR